MKSSNTKQSEFNEKIIWAFVWAFTIIAVLIGWMIHQGNILGNVSRNSQNKFDSIEEALEDQQKVLRTGYVGSEEFNELERSLQRTDEWLSEVRRMQLQFQEKVEARIPVMNKI